MRWGRAMGHGPPDLLKPFWDLISLVMQLDYIETVDWAKIGYHRKVRRVRRMGTSGEGTIPALVAVERKQDENEKDKSRRR